MFRSISGQLQASYGLLVLLALIGLGIFGFLHRKSETFREVDESLQNRSKRINSMLVRRDLQGLPEQREESEADKVPQLPPLPGAQVDGEEPSLYYKVWIYEEGVADLLFESQNAPVWSSPVPHPREINANGQIITTDAAREMLSRVGRNYVILVGTKTVEQRSELRRFVIHMILWEALFLALFILAGYWLTKRALSPIKEISDTARRIADGSLDQRISLERGSSELREVSEVLNESFDHLESSILRQREFTSNASHELRTPITAILAEGQSRPKTTEDYRKSLERCVDTARAMKQLVDQLLELSRFDSGEKRLRREATDLDLLVDRAIQMVRPLADGKSISIETQLDVIEAAVNPVRITQVLINLLNNAVSYTNEGGKISVRLSEKNDSVEIAVEDNGVGISNDDLPNIFNRFYRTDKARSDHEANHFGLGLAISREIAIAHGGDLQAKSEPGEGSIFVLTFPCNGI